LAVQARGSSIASIQEQRGVVMADACAPVLGGMSWTPQEPPPESD
jgi:hypothetical protein